MKKFFFIILVLLNLCTNVFKDVHAADNTLIANCVASYDFGQLNKSSVTVKPITPSCANLCERQCKSMFSRTVAVKNGRPLELNQDVIYDCISACQLGRPFQSYFYEGISKIDGSYEVVVRNQMRNDATCISFYGHPLDGMSISTINYTEAKVYAGKAFRLQLLRGLENKVYRCGRKSVKLKPLVNSMDPAVWNRMGTPSAEEAKYREETNPCFRMQYPYIGDPDRAIVPTDGINPYTSNFSLWSGLDLNKGKDKCYWSARNPFYTDTGINIMDGDELSVTYQGDFPYHWVNPPTVYNSRKELFDLYKTRPDMRSSILWAWQMNSLIAIMKPDFHHADYAAPIEDTQFAFCGECARITKPGKDLISILGEDLTPEELNNPPSTAMQIGLKGITTDFFKAVSQITEGSDCDTEDKRRANISKCRVIIDPGPGSYNFSGTVSGLASVRGPFAIKHFDWDHSNNLGGFEVEIDWGGCPAVNGEGLQYVILDQREDGNYRSVFIPENAWRDYPADGFDETFSGIIADRNGVLAFRIKPAGYPIGTPGRMTPVHLFPGYRMGEYNFIVDAYDEEQTFVVVKFLRDYTKIIRDTLFGDRRVTNGVTNEGVVMLLYNNIIRDGNLYAILYSMLVLYLALTGLGFIIGTVELNQKELVARSLKFAIVAAITSPMSWRFFADNFLYGFIDGGLTLIALVATAGLTNTPVNIEADPINVLYLFDMPLKMMFSGATWTKIYALLFVNIMGLVMVIMICFSAAMYFIAVLKAVAILMFSMIGIAVLVLMAPIFLSMILFQFTREFFDRWWKYLVSFTLQPVAVFVMICIFNIMITIAMKTMLGFTACPYCFFKIKVPNIEGLNSYFIDWCFFQAYAPFTSAFYQEAPAFELPNRTVEGMLFFVIMALGMYQLTSVISSVINRIVTGMLVNTFNLGSYADSAESTIKGNASEIAAAAKSGVGKIRDFGQKLQDIAADNAKADKKGGGGGGTKDEGGEKDKAGEKDNSNS